jgi:hypothetical protein
MDEVRQGLGQEWDEAREGVVGALRLWLIATIGGCMLTVIREVAACAAAAEKSGKAGKEAADELATSWEFLQQVMGTWLDGVDVEHIAEVLLDDYIEKYENAPAATTDETPDTPTAAQARRDVLDELFRNKTRPSAN